MQSLKDQLLKAGLVSEDQARKASHARRQENKKVGADERQAQAQQRAAEAKRQAEEARLRDQALNKARDLALAEKSRQAQAALDEATEKKQVIQMGRLSHWEGNRNYFFADGGQIFFLQVNEEAARKLEQGQAAIARTGQTGAPYTLVSGGAARRLAELQPDWLVTFHQE